jgi:Glycosyltransferase family 25 (LPS biosynthesis protein)
MRGAQVTDLTLRHAFSPEVAATYIIYLPLNQVSVGLASRAMEACATVDQPATLFRGFDGTNGMLRIPGPLAAESWPYWIKLYDERLTSSQIACAFSHFALWTYCMAWDQPIVVLEHDAVMLAPYRRHRYPNTIAHLGGSEQGPVNALSSGGNWRFLGGTHAYAIDPLAAHRLFAIVLDRGIYAPLDVMLRLADVAVIPEPGHAELQRGQSTVDSNMKDPE